MNFSTQILKTSAIVVLTGGTIIGSVLGGHKVADIISNRFYKKREPIENEENNDNKDDEAYEYKYIDDYQKRYDDMVLENKNQAEIEAEIDAEIEAEIEAETEAETEAEKYKSDLEVKLNGTKIHEITPKGDVIMYYDTNLESFVYYCDDKNIPYKYLETVARKYSLDNNCLEIFVNMYDELKKGIERQKEAKIKKCKEDANKNDNLDQENGKTDVFATFKQYNKTNPKEMIKQRKYITKENANRYSYRGNIASGKELRIENPKKEVSIGETGKQLKPQSSVNSVNMKISDMPKPSGDRKKMSFSDFKRMQSSTSVDTLPVKTLEEWVESDNEVSSLFQSQMNDSPTFSPVHEKRRSSEVTMSEQQLTTLLED